MACQMKMKNQSQNNQKAIKENKTRHSKNVEINKRRNSKKRTILIHVYIRTHARTHTHTHKTRISSAEDERKRERKREDGVRTRKTEAERDCCGIIAPGRNGLQYSREFEGNCVEVVN